MSGRGSGPKAAFPATRIKRIMQSDEDVGKLATVTPALVSKAVELFLGDLVRAASTLADANHHTKITPAHIRHVVEGNEQFDFCKDLVIEKGAAATLPPPSTKTPKANASKAVAQKASVPSQPSPAPTKPSAAPIQSSSDEDEPSPKKTKVDL